MNLMVSDTIAYSKAVMRWLGLSEAEWHPAAYGDHIPGVYGEARLVRPSSGVEEWHVDWYFKKLVTAVLDKVSIFPDQWEESAAT